MAGRCTVCRHERVAEIDEALVEGAPKRSIAVQYSLSPTAVQRHRESHLPEKLVRAKQIRDLTQAGELLSRVLSMERAARRILDSAEASGDLRTALQGIDRVLRSLALQGNLKERWETEALLERLQELLEEKEGSGYARK